MFYFVGLLMVLWALYKFIYAKKVVGKIVEIKPFRKKSSLLFFKDEISNLKVEKIVRVEGDNWLYAPLNGEVVIKGEVYDYLIMSAKKPDDNVNRKKPVVCSIKAGYSLGANKVIFVDWGLVQIVK